VPAEELRGPDAVTPSTAPPPTTTAASVGAGRPGRLAHWGRASWRIVGVLVATAMILAILAALSGLVVPLLFAVVVGMLAVPAVDWLADRGIPRQLGAILLIVGLIALLLAVAVVVVRGLVDESVEIRVAVDKGAAAIGDWLDGRNIDIGDPGAFVDGAVDQGRPLLTGAASWATTIFSSALAFAIGGFLALFMLYYILVDWVRVRGWVAVHLGVPRDLGPEIIDDATDVVRRGFGVLTLTSLTTAGVIGLTMVVLGIPLALAVATVTFVTSYVPYLGAILSGGFGLLVALGNGGLDDALILLVVILIVQNVVQPIVGNWLTTDRLSLHPLPSIIASVGGVAIAGLVGAILAVPTLALAIAVSRRVSSTRGADPPIVDVT
jgi:putative heme transporter